MDVISNKENFLEPDFIQVSGLKRSNWNLLWHPNGEFLKNLEFSGIQVYLLEGTIYGCFINKTKDNKIEAQWFGHHLSSVKNHEGKVVPSSTMELYRLLEMCDPSKVEGILFNLDVLG